MKMKKRLLIVLAAGFGLLFLNSTTMAGYLDSGWENITQPDGYGYNGSGWHSKHKEDNEVEPGATTGQNWDIEGFYFSDGANEDIPDNELALVGGFDFQNGEPWGDQTVGAGDIFITADMPSGYYEYVMDLDFTTDTYDVYQITDRQEPIMDQDQTVYVYESGVNGPNATQYTPWKYSGSGASLIGSGFALGYLQYNNDNDAGGGVQGYGGNNSHDIVLVNLGFLGGNTSFEVLNTMACGNDVVFGAGSTTAAVPEPATIFLLGSGLLGLFGYRKKFRKSKS
jgi:hypothetical protein